MQALLKPIRVNHILWFTKLDSYKRVLKIRYQAFNRWS